LNFRKLYLKIENRKFGRKNIINAKYATGTGAGEGEVDAMYREWTSKQLWLRMMRRTMSTVLGTFAIFSISRLV